MCQSRFSEGSMAMIISIFILLAEFTNGQSFNCLASVGTECGNIDVPGGAETMPLDQYIQTFDASSCVGTENNMLKITQITTNYKYTVATDDVIVTFKLQIFIPNSLDALTTENIIETAQITDTLTVTNPNPYQFKPIVFNNLDIILGCNDKYGYQGKFGLYVSISDCQSNANPSDPDCTITFDGGPDNSIYPMLCFLPTPDLETLYVYDASTAIPAISGFIDLSNPSNMFNDNRMNIDIVYSNNNIQCTCDTSIERTNNEICGNTMDPLPVLSLNSTGTSKVIQKFNSDCFYSQNLDYINIDIAYETKSGFPTAPQELFTLSVTNSNQDINKTIPYPSWQGNSNVGYHVFTLSFGPINDLFVGGCGDTAYNWSLTCTQCNDAYFYQTAPNVALCSSALSMNDYPVYYYVNNKYQQYPNIYASFALIEAASFECPPSNVDCSYQSSSIPLCDSQIDHQIMYIGSKFWQQMIPPNINVTTCNAITITSIQFAFNNPLADNAQQTYVASMWRTSKTNIDINDPNGTVYSFEQYGSNSLINVIQSNIPISVNFTWENNIVINMDDNQDMTYFISIELINTGDSNKQYIIEGCEDTLSPALNYSIWHYDVNQNKYLYLNKFLGLTRWQLKYNLSFCCGIRKKCTPSDQCPTTTTINPTSYPTSNPITTQPTTGIPTTKSPTTKTPTTKQPTTSEPTTAIPTTSIPTTNSPVTTDQPTTDSPTTNAPTTVIPITDNPTTDSPTTAHPTTTMPTNTVPTAANPTAANPTTDIPTTSDPTTANPTASNPTTADPTTANPTTDNPTTYNPTTYNPTTYNPTTDNPTTDNPTAAVSTNMISTTASSYPTTNKPTTSHSTTIIIEETTNSGETTLKPTEDVADKGNHFCVGYTIIVTALLLIVKCI